MDVLDTTNMWEGSREVQLLKIKNLLSTAMKWNISLGEKFFEKISLKMLELNADEEIQKLYLKYCRKNL